MTDAADLLDPESAAFERALARAMSDELPVPIAQIMAPATTPMAFLPFLAAHESVDLWFDDWPEARKRQMVAEALELASLKGTRAAAERYLAYVDTEIVHKVSHPARYPVGKMAAGVQPVHHKPFVARWLLKVALKAPPKAVCVTRTAISRAAVRTVNREPLRRAKIALSTSKAPETSYTVNFAHRVPITLDASFDLGVGHVLGKFHDRIRL